MTAASRFTKTYRAVRNANWLWALIATWFFFNAINAIIALSSHGKEASVVSFMFWSAACTGMVIAIRRNKARNK